MLDVTEVHTDYCVLNTENFSFTLRFNIITTGLNGWWKKMMPTENQPQKWDFKSRARILSHLSRWNVGFECLCTNFCNIFIHLSMYNAHKILTQDTATTESIYNSDSDF